MIKKNDFLVIGAQEPIVSRLADNSNVFKGIPPYFMPYGKDFIKISRRAYNFPAYALPILIACLKRKNISASSINDFYSEDPEKLKKAVLNTGYAVCVSTTFLTSPRSIIKIIDFVRSIKPSLTILTGGPGIINLPETRKYSDINVFYEGEETIQELAPAICRRRDISGIKGISYFKRKKEIVTDRRECIANLGDIPLPSWEALSDKVKTEKYLPIESSRGCIGKCSFCLETKYWPGIRFYPVNRVIKELKENNVKFGIKSYYFQDSNISNNKIYLEKLCDAIRNERLKISWSCESRIDTITKELIDKMFAAGCRGITFGMESADPRILKNMNKNMSDQKMKAFLAITKHMRKREMLANINIIVGFPGEDKKSIGRTIDFLLKAGPITYSMSKFFLERGTDIWKNRAGFGLKGIMHRWEHDTMKSGELDPALRHIFLSLSKDLEIYHWPSAALDLIRNMGRGKSFEDFVAYLRSVNQICVEDLTRKNKSYSREYDRSFRYIAEFLS